MTNNSKQGWRSINLLTVPEVAEWMKVHPKTVYRWIKTGKFEAIRFGARTYRIPERTVNDYLHKNGFSHLIGQGGEQ